jgi:hypothetical protein
MASMLLKDMVGPCGLEPQTSTVSKIRGSRTRHRTLWVGVWVGNSYGSSAYLRLFTMKDLPRFEHVRTIPSFQEALRRLRGPNLAIFLEISGMRGK